MAAEHPTRPTVQDGNRLLDQRLRRIPHMDLKRWKIFKSILVSLAFFIFGGFAIHAGADPFKMGALVVFAVGAYNGIEWGELTQIGQGIGIEITAVEDQNDDSN